MKAHYSSENTSINQKMQGHMQMYDSDTQEKKKKKQFLRTGQLSQNANGLWV